MKPKVMILNIFLISLIVCAWNVSQAEDFLRDFALKASGGVLIPNDRHIGTGKEFTAHLEYKNTFYLWGSYDYFTRELGGKKTDPIEIYGIGLGVQNKVLKTIGLDIPILKDINAWANFGYFFPTHYIRGPEFYHEISSNYGGSGGLSLEHKIIDNFSLGINAGYHFLKVNNELKVWDRFGRVINHNIHYKDFEGPLLGVTLKYNF